MIVQIRMLEVGDVSVGRSMVQLSLCIPTLDGRARSLSETLTSIHEQLDARTRPLVEVCISDTVSMDGTADVVAGFRERGLEVVYVRHEVNNGLTRNVFDAAALASGRHLWLFSSDDAIVDGGIAEVLDLLAAHPDAAGFTVARSNMDAGLEREVSLDGPAVLPDDWERGQVLEGIDAVWSQLGLLQTYLSAQIVAADAWRDAVREHGDAVVRRDGNFPHLWIFGHMLRTRPSWVWHPAKLVENRTANSLLAAEVGGSDARWVLTVLPELAEIWADALGRRSAAFRRLTRRAYGEWATPEKVRSHRAERDGAGATARLAIGLGRRFAGVPAFWRRTVPALVRPLPREPEGHKEPLPEAACRARVRVSGLPDELRALRTIQLDCDVANDGPEDLWPTGTHPVAVGHRWAFDDGDVVEGMRAFVRPVLAGGAQAHLELLVATPARAGGARLSVSLVQEGVRWFDDLDPANGWSASVTIEPMRNPVAP